MPFDIGIPELLVVFVVVLMVFGPERIPELARSLGGMVRDLRKTASDLTRDFTAEMDAGAVAGGPKAVCATCGGLNAVGQAYCGHCSAKL